jgi:hypothetical protein
VNTTAPSSETLDRTVYRPGGPRPAQTLPPGAEVPGRNRVTGYAEVWTVVGVALGSRKANQVTVRVTRTMPQPVGSPRIVELEATLTSHGFTLAPLNAGQPGLGESAQRLLHDPEFVSYHLYAAHKFGLKQPLPTRRSNLHVHLAWLDRMRLNADLFTLTDPAVRATAWHCAQSGHVRTLEDLTAVLVGAFGQPGTATDGARDDC